MDPVAIIIILAAALLVVYAVRGTILKAKGKAKSSCCGGPEVKSQAVADTDESHYPYHYDLTISGMKCSNCARTVENTFNQTPGVWAKVDLSRHAAHVLAKQEMSRDDFVAALSSTDYLLSDFH